MGAVERHVGFSGAATGMDGVVGAEAQGVVGGGRNRGMTSPGIVLGTPKSEKERDEATSKLESRLRRLKTVYFGGGKKEKEGGKHKRGRASSLVVGLGRNGAPPPPPGSPPVPPPATAPGRH